MKYYALGKINLGLQLQTIIDGSTKPNPAIDSDTYLKCLALINPNNWKNNLQSLISAEDMKLYCTHNQGTLVNENVFNAVWDSISDILPFTPDKHTVPFKNIESSMVYRVIDVSGNEYILNRNTSNKLKPEPKPKSAKTPKNFVKDAMYNLREVALILQNGGKVISLDFEAYEFKQERMLEAGVSVISKNDIITRHYIVKENMHHQNKRYVKGNRDNFLFGTSEILSLAEIKVLLQEDLLNCDILIGQSVASDLKFLNSFLHKKIKLRCFDTSQLKYIFDCGGSLPVLCAKLGIQTDKLHNAGNDSHFSAMLLQNAIQCTKEKLESNNVAFI